MTERKIGELLDVPKSTVHNTIARFKETGTDERKPGSGRPRTARTLANKQKIKAKIKRNPNSRKNSSRKMAKALGISATSVRRIIHKDISAKSRKKLRGKC
jgi:predicted XRE-type DNA-binding protein